ncbi:Bgt-50823 [Blumeria graminis f. sp. tritici]|uniref:Bgt-50823 n=1 Tax=Blumeria graminis f. sp. tritici TaxID=62690 RepID=A0A9X9MJG6_BLUGR|nr:Bgt-50823 [Blumeria graminis f. sp. tritici]
MGSVYSKQILNCCYLIARAHTGRA